MCVQLRRGARELGGRRSHSHLEMVVPEDFGEKSKPRNTFLEGPFLGPTVKWHITRAVLTLLRVGMPGDVPDPSTTSKRDMTRARKHLRDMGIPFDAMTPQQIKCASWLLLYAGTRSPVSGVAGGGSTRGGGRALKLRSRSTWKARLKPGLPGCRGNAVALTATLSPFSSSSAPAASDARMLAGADSDVSATAPP